MLLRKKMWFILFAVFLIGFGAADFALSEGDPDVHYVPTPQYAVNEMLEIAGTNKNDVVYDLGCGDGRFVITAAKNFGARGIGIDIDPDRIRESQSNAKNAGVSDRVKFYEQDLFKTDISQATIVALYLLPELNLRLRPKLFKELKPGTRIVSHDFDMGDWKPDVTGELGNSIYYYWVLPADVTGKWRISAPALSKDGDYTLEMIQKFQNIQINPTSKGPEVSISNVKLVGDKISFLLSKEIRGNKVGMHFKGQVTGNKITGSVQVEVNPFSTGIYPAETASLIGSHNWTAVRSE